MDATAMPPLELILRQCAGAAPQPWYPSDFLRETGAPRGVLDPHLDRLRLGGFIGLTEWVEGRGQGYVLTPAGQELVDKPRFMARVREGLLPERRPEPPPEQTEEV